MRLAGMRDDGNTSQISTIEEVLNTKVGHLPVYIHNPTCKSTSMLFLNCF